jgi:class 3 adenylate cyclase
MSQHGPVARSERRFATVLFTDIVGSTARSAEVGDQAWRDLLDRHDRIAWQAVERQDRQCRLSRILRPPTRG